MKSSSLSILLSVLAAVSVAQSFEFGINVGITSYKLHNFYSGGVYENVQYFQSSVVSVPVSAIVMYDYKKFQFGAVVGRNTITYKSLSDFDLGIFPYATLQHTVYETPVGLQANRIIKFKKFTGYVGLSGLYQFTKSARKDIGYTYPGGSNGLNVSNNSSAIGFGAQVGATYFLTRHIGFNVVVSRQCNNFPAGTLDKNIISVPVSIGFRYKL